MSKFEKICFLLRGFPGSGKSSLVKKILSDYNVNYDHVFSTDSLFISTTLTLEKVDINNMQLSDVISLCEKVRKILHKGNNEEFYVNFVKLFGSGDYYQALSYVKQNIKDLEIIEYRNNWNPASSGYNHKQNQQNFFKAVDSGISPVIVDNTNVSIKDGAIYVQYAHKNGYKIFIQEPNSPHWNEYKEYLNNRYLHKNKIQDFADLLFKKNVHGVPKETILKMIDKWALNPSLNDYLNYGKERYND